MRIDLSYYLPVGISQRKELTGIGLGLAASGLWSMGFLGRYLASYRRLFLDFDPSTGILNGNTMDSFSVLMGNGLAVFCLYWLSLAGLVVWHYLYHRKGAMSIYLMKRLPQPLEYHRRCLLLPLGAAVAGLMLVGLLGGIYYAIYILCTPAGCFGGI